MKQADVVQAVMVAALVGAAGWFLMRRQAAAAPVPAARLGLAAPLGIENPEAWGSSVHWSRLAQPYGLWDMPLRQVEAGYSTGRRGM